MGRKTHAYEFTVLFVYALFLVIVISFHEPWFDEAQSWLIARDASFYDILFTIPHYEGHPPFWWLILSIPAKLGMPYELSLKAINVAFSIFAAYLVLFYSPFPKWIRCVLPFTYFLFYQYGVQSRPYSIMVCALLLAAITWRERDIKPFHFCIALGLLCFTSAYGIIIAGGIALAWTVEALRERSLFNNYKRLIAMFILFFLALVLIYEMIPYPDTYANSRIILGETNTLPQRFYYAFFCLPSEAIVTSCGSDSLFHFFVPSISQTIVMSAISLALWTCLLVNARNSNSLLYLILPSVFFLSFSAAKYFYLHHVGILFLLFLFSVWISWKEDNSYRKELRVAIKVGCALIMAVSCYWSMSASLQDIKTDFSAGKALAKFIKENHLENYRWAASWARETDEDNNDILLYENTHEVHGAVIEANPYLEKPLLDGALSGKSYADHILPSEDEMLKEKQALLYRGTDIVVGLPLSEEYRSPLGLTGKCAVLESIESGYIWKNHKGWNITFVCGKDEIAAAINGQG